jgi:hypothetical protein
VRLSVTRLTGFLSACGHPDPGEPATAAACVTVPARPRTWIQPLAWAGGPGPGQVGGRPSKPKSGSGLVSGLLVAEDLLDDFGVPG